MLKIAKSFNPLAHMGTQWPYQLGIREGIFIRFLVLHYNFPVSFPAM